MTATKCLVDYRVQILPLNMIASLVVWFRSRTSGILGLSIQLFEDSEMIKNKYTAQTLVAVLSGRNRSLVSAVGIHRSSTMTKMRWVLSVKWKSEKLLQELGWFIDKLYEFVPMPETHLIIIVSELQEHVSTPVAPKPLLLPQPTTSKLIDQSGAGRRCRIEHRQSLSMSKSGIRRTRKEHIRRIAAAAIKQAEEVRVNER